MLQQAHEFTLVSISVRQVSRPHYWAVDVSLARSSTANTKHISTAFVPIRAEIDAQAVLTALTRCGSATRSEREKSRPHRIGRDGGRPGSRWIRRAGR